MHWAGIGIGIVILLSLWRAHRSDKLEDFSLFDLIMENGRISKMWCMAWGAFVVAGWIVVDLQITKRLTEGYYIAFLGSCLAPILAKLIGGKDDKPTD